MYHICIVEDEPNIIEALCYLFEKQNWSVDVISDGEGAASQIIKMQPALIVLDQMLPNLSGLAVAKAIRAESKTAQTPILMLSAKAQQKDKEQAQIAGVNHFMTKPFSNSDLLDEIKQLLAQNQSH